MNLYAATGNVCGDAEVRHTNSGKAVCTFTLAVKAGYGDRESTLFVRCLIWGKRAEGSLPQYILKGGKLAVHGELSLNEWEDKDGGKRSTLECKVAQIDLLGGSPGNQSASNSKPQNNNTPGSGVSVGANVPF